MTKLIAGIAAVALLAVTSARSDGGPIRTRSQYGIGCMSYVRPGAEMPKELPPQSYLAADMGRPGFPKLTARERSTVRRFATHANAKTLRIAWVAAISGEHGFIVFDAYDGPCETWAPGYKVLNGTCNEYYEPGENPYYSHAVMGCY